MKKHFSKLLVTLFICMLGTIMIATSAITAFAADTNEAAAVAEEEITATLTDSGVCGTNATWKYYAEIGTLKISGSGAITSSPWSSYRSKITKVVVSDGITSIATYTFSGLSALKEITLPFVGESRTATGPKATFGYIFGYTTMDAYADYDSSSSIREYHGIFNGNDTTMVGHTEYSYENSSYTSKYVSNGTSYSSLGWSSASGYTTTKSTTFMDYRVGYNTNTYSSNSNYYAKFAQPSGTTWQYSCNDAQWGSYGNIYTLQSYYYYIPASITKVTITDATKIETAAFMNCSNITEIRFSKNVTSIGTNAFRNCKTSVKVTNDTITYPNSYSYTNGKDTFYYSIDADGNATITDCVTTSVNITLPVSLGGYTVTTVGYRAMADCTTLSAITIPNNITHLESYAFAGCTGLDVVTIPATCTYVGKGAFSGCSSMTTAIISEGVLYLGDYAFENCVSLTEIVVPDSCEYLGKYAFYNCKVMESASVGNSTPAIQEYTFYNCQKLKTIVVGIKVESIGDYAFYNTALSTLYLHQLPNLKTIGDYAFASCDNMTTVRLRAIESLGEGVFMGNGLLSAINLPNTLKEIGAYAFHGCSSLTSVTIPALVTNIKDYTFAFAGLDTATVNGTLDYIGEKAFYRNNLSTFTFKEGLSSIGADAFAFNEFANIVLPNSLTYVGEQAFNECNILATVSMPDSVSYVGQYAFSKNATDLTITIRYNSGKIADYMLYNTDVYAVIMEDGITEIGNYVFALDHELTNITFPNTLQVIGDYAFYDNRIYSELTLPNTVTNIGTYAFARGYNFVKINIPDSVQAIGSHAFYREQATDHISPEFTVEIYYNKGVIADNLLDGQHIQHIIVNDYIHTVGNNAFSNCMNLMDISLPDTIASFGNNCFLNDNGITMNIRSVDKYIDDEIYKEKLNGVSVVNIDNTIIGDYAFYGNNTLNNINIVGLSDIKTYAFANCLGLLKTTLIGSANIGEYAFYNCNAMHTFTIDGTIERIGEHAFDSCKALGAMVLPATVNYIGSYAFYDCNSMPSINIPNGIERIKSHTFYGCAALQNIETPNSVVAIEDYAFYGCVVAKTITISNICEEIGEAAFYNCKAVEELIIPDSVKSIGDYAFRSCVEVTELRFSDNIETLGASAFYDCNALESVYLGKKIIELKDNLFYGCVNLKSLYVYAPLSYIDETAFFGAYEVTVYCGRDDYMINFFDENFIFYEILDELVYEYKIVFQTDNGEIISSKTYTSGSTVTVPTNPTKTADETYTYVFAGWDSEVTIVGGNKTYTANFTPVYIDYTVVFKNYDGTEISSKTYHYGDKVVAPSTPEKPANNTYTYTFNGWDNEVVDCVGNATYTATYTPVYINYTVEFKNYDGTLLSSKTYHYGDAVVVPSTPTKPADNTYTYYFKDWSKEVVNCAGNTTYTATYNKTYIDYTVIFEDEDGTVLSEKTYHYGDSVVEPTAPSKPADETYTYGFAGWDSEVVNCDGNKTYIAQFAPTNIEYLVVFKDYDGTELSSKTYHFGDEIIEPTNPTRLADNTYTYTFNGWDKDVVNCNGNAEYKATYTATYIDYTITFKNDNGTILSEKTYHYGQVIVEPAIPTKDADNTYTYAFKSWDKEIVNCEGNAVYTATYNRTYIEYTVIFKNYDGEILSGKTYHYGDDVVEPATPTKPADESCTYGFSGWDSEVVNCDGNKTYIAQFVPINIEYTVTFLNWDNSILSSKTYNYGDKVVVPTNPTKPADNTYTYTFNGWDKDVADCNGNATYVAQYKNTYIEYTVTFLNWDNSEIKKATYHYGDTIVSIPNPERENDETFTYEFSSWNKPLGICTGNTKFTAQYDATYINYSVVFKDENGVVLSRKNDYHYGDAIVKPANPEKASDNTYTYAFKGWKNFSSVCVGNAEYTPEFTSTYIEYSVVFKNYDNSVLGSKTYHYGDTIVEPATPTKPADNTYSYAFAGWDKTIQNCVGNVEYKATYTQSYIDYTVEFKDSDGTFLSSNTYHYGDEVIAPTNPTKMADNTYTYSFKSWDKEIVNCNGNTIYTATYNQTYIDYTVVFKNYDGTEISSTTYHYGDAVVAPSTPSKAEDNTYTYTFSGWDKDVVNCNGNATYTATYSQEYRNYTVKFVNDDGTEISSTTYHYGDEVVEPTAPTKASDGNYTYTFAGWDSEVVNCNGDKTYTATYNSKPIEKGGSGCASVTTGGSSGGAIGDGFTVALATMGGAAVLLMVRRKKEKYNKT